ncbi:nucleic acid-binding, OB-fold, replication protein A, OB domain protein [Tanacetum coccineum]
MMCLEFNIKVFQHAPSVFDCERFDGQKFAAVTVIAPGRYNLSSFKWCKGVIPHAKLIGVSKRGENKIVATVKESICPKFEKYLEEGKCFYISTFSVGDSQGTPKIIENKNKIHFYKATDVTPCESYSGSVNGFRFKSFDTLLQEENQSSVSCGDLISCGTIAHAMVDGNRRPFIRLELEDLTGTKLRNITLWGDYALQLNNALGDRQNLGHVVIILQFMKHKIYKFVLAEILASLYKQGFGRSAKDHKDVGDITQDAIATGILIQDAIDIMQGMVLFCKAAVEGRGPVYNFDHVDLPPYYLELFRLYNSVALVFHIFMIDGCSWLLVESLIVYCFCELGAVN